MMPFRKLCDTSRTSRKLGTIPNDFKVLSFDPGETTGWCYFVQFSLQGHGQLATDEIGEGMNDYVTLINAIKPDLIVCEDYKVYSTHLKQHEWSELLTPKLVGIIEGLGAQRKIPVVKQMAGRIKAFCTDDKLHAWRMYQPGKRHARDAIRHACFFLAFGELPNHEKGSTST